MSTSQAVHNATKTTKEKQAPSPRSLTRILQLFEVIAGSDEGLSLSELSVELKAPKSSLLLLLKPLVAMGYLSHTSARYMLGSAAFTMATTLLSARKFPKLIRPYMEELAERTGESIFLAALDRDAKTVTYIECVESSQAIRYAVPTGSVRPLYPSAAGRALLAFQDDEWLKNYLKTTKLTPLTGKTQLDRSALRRELETVRNTGVAVTEGEAIQGAAGIAAPLFGRNNIPTHALLIGAPADRFHKELPSLRSALLEVVGKASEVLKG